MAAEDDDGYDSIYEKAEAEGISEEEAEEYSERNREELSGRLIDRERELSAEAAEARDILSNLGTRTRTIDLGEAFDADTSIELEVTSELSGRALPAIRTLFGSDDTDADEDLDATLTLLEELVVGPPGYDDRDAWLDVYYTRGPEFLGQCLAALLQPVYEDSELVRQFREDE